MAKELEFDDLMPGEDIGSRTYTITEKMINTCANAIESQHPWYSEGSPFAGRIAPPTIFDNEVLGILDAKYARSGSIHAKQEWEFLNPVSLGQKVTARVKLLDKYIRRERKYLVWGLEVVDEHGVEICRGRYTSLLSLKKE